MSEVLAYIRVSTVEQNTARQLDGVKYNEVFEDKCSGSTTSRPALDELKRYARNNDTVIVHDISRLARNIKDLIELIEFFNEKGVTVKFHKENMEFSADSNNPMNKLMLNLLGSVYEFERNMMLERQREGIAKAKAAGKYKGRPSTVDYTTIQEELRNGTSIRRTAELCNVNASTVQKAKKMMT